MKKLYTKREQLEHLENWKKCGLSKNAYAKSAGINPRTFIGWTWRTKESVEKKQNFVEIKKVALMGNSQDIVIEKAGIRIRLPIVTGMQELQTVFMALGGIQ